MSTGGNSNGRFALSRFARGRLACIAALLSALLIPAAAVAEGPPPAWVAEARDAAKALGSQLAAELESAISNHGPLAAVDVCNLRAPAIAAAVSGAHRSVGRTAIRVRNPANAPDDWERSILERFEDRLARGASPAGLETWRVDTADGVRTGRFMKAIPLAPKCVICHGDTIAPKLEARIRRLYPEDEATGFAPGDLRGAFSVTLELPPAD